MQLTILVRLHARDGEGEAVAAAIDATIPPSRAEPGCLAIEAMRAEHDPQLFFIQSRWADAAALELHGGLPHTTAFLAHVKTLVDEPVEMTRGRPI